MAASAAMAEPAGGAAPVAQPQAASRWTASGGDVSARLQQALALLFPSNLAAKAALFALVVALLPLLPSAQQAPRIWDLPHLLLLGIVISYGVFGQKNADAESVAAAAASAKPVDDDGSVEAYVSQMMQGPLVFESSDDRDGDGGGGGPEKDGLRAWSSQYLPDDPLVVVAEAGIGNGSGDKGEKPLLLPVRKLNPAAEEPAATLLTGDISDGSSDEEEFIAAPAKAGYAYDGVRDHAIPSPSSVLDADLTLSPSSPPLLPPPPPPPPPPSFLGRGRSRLQKAKARSFNEFGAIGNRSVVGGRLGGLTMTNKQFRSKSAVRPTRSGTFTGYDPAAPIDAGDEEEDEALDAELDELVAASEDSSFSGDGMVTDGDGDNEGDSFEEDEQAAAEDEEEEDGNSCDDELFELAKRPGPAPPSLSSSEEEVGDEVDRKADEFIAKFREQIRMQRVEPARR